MMIRDHFRVFCKFIQIFLIGGGGAADRSLLLLIQHSSDLAAHHHADASSHHASHHGTADGPQHRAQNGNPHADAALLRHRLAPGE